MVVRGVVGVVVIVGGVALRWLLPWQVLVVMSSLAAVVVLQGFQRQGRARRPRFRPYAARHPVWHSRVHAPLAKRARCRPLPVSLALDLHVSASSVSFAGSRDVCHLRYHVMRRGASGRD